jgi:transposase
MNYIGLDCHKHYTFATKIVAESGEIIKQKLVNTPEELRGFIGEGSRVVLEAGRNWGFIYDMIDEEDTEVKLAHPLKVKAIASAKIKTDAIDSHTLAYLLSADLIPEAHLRDKANRSKQQVLRQRAFYVNLRTRVKNRIHALIDKQPYEARKSIEGVKDLFGKAGMQWLRSVELSPQERKLLNSLLELLEQLTTRIAESDGLVKQLYQKDEDAQLLKSIPGIGDFFSVLISTEVDGIARFASAEKFASYCGLVPATYASGGKIRHGRIIKQGNRWLRWALVEAVWPAIRNNAQLRSYYERIRSRKGVQVAAVATARKMAIIVFKVMKDKREFICYRGRPKIKNAS